MSESTTAAPTTTPAAPAVNGQVVGLAHYASRAVLERRLTPSGTTFNQSLALNALARAGGSADRAQLLGRLAGSLKLPLAELEAVLDELLAAGRLAELPGEPGRLGLTSEGRALQQEISGFGAEIAARLYAGIPAEDLAAAARVLALVTERADAELSAS
ncbi:MarR family winged helix-turn-helix transcriptional regulator [Kitasatospora camelliae]|uniref:MarR family winged helix-turn-helix transcriptional regulator n=1 Tax=Kitasatospora camelliae TaxID=3156397 RepID=A0AAU8JX49_9ACTN